MDDPNPSGLCQCGCGRQTTIVESTHLVRGRVRGHHARYLRGHWRRGRAQTPEHRARLSASHKGKRTGAASATFKGWVRVARGRTTIFVGKAHPMADTSGYVLRYRLVMAAHLRRYLSSDEHVHHVDLDYTNDEPDNLVIVTRSQHMRIHQAIRRGLTPRAAVEAVLA